MARLYQERTKLPPQIKWIAAAVGAFFLGFFLVDAWTRQNLNLSFLLPVALSVIFWFTFKRQENGVGPNSLEVDDHGLTFKHQWLIRRWAWSELSAPELARCGVNFDACIRLRTVKPMDWIGRLVFPGLSLSSTGSEICILPIFGVPLEDMLEEINTSRERSSRVQDELPEIAVLTN